MKILITAVVIGAILGLLALALSARIVKQYEHRFGRVLGVWPPGLRLIIPVVDVLRRVSLRTVSMPIQSQGIITRDNVSVDVSVVIYFTVIDAVESVGALENVYSAIDQIARNRAAQSRRTRHLDQALTGSNKINLHIRAILDGDTDPPTRRSPRYTSDRQDETARYS